MPRASIALANLRGFVIVMVLAFHSFIAYMVTQPATQLPFNAPPYDWTAHPIVDADRFLGFDLFGAFQFLHLMQLMCFMSGLFVWPSLIRKGPATFVRGRMMRLGVPFLFGVYLMMPFTYYPVYRVGAVDPSWAAFWSHWMELPFWPCGPLWFLWFILALNILAAGVYWLVPHSETYLGRLSAYAGNHPVRFFFGLVLISAVAYVPMAAYFPPWRWVEYGPIAFQPGFVPQYTVFFFAGLAVGVQGIERGFLATDAKLAQRWPLWLAAAFASFVLWVAPAALITKGLDHGLPFLPTLRELGLVLFAASACFGSTAVFLRFIAMRRPVLGSIADNSYGIYLFHYFFVIWTQYALLQYQMPAIAKGLIVLAVTLSLSWAVSAAVGNAPAGARLIRGARHASVAEAKASAKTESP
jgi:glucans biosynthesis protein C